VKAFLLRVGAFLRPLLGPLGAAIVLVGAVLLVSMGFKELQVGGLLARLLGRKPPEKKAIEVANSVPEGRVRSDGSLIPIGESDSKGQTQAAVVPLDEPGLFSNPDTVRFTPPGEAEPIEVALPEGVKRRDVDHVVVVSPSVVAVTVKDASGISAQTVDELLRKYGP
jgi:hypothetical protein